MPSIPQRDLDEILASTSGLWKAMRGERIFISGGTGFFGCWLVESFLHANRVLGLGAEATVLTRNPEAFLAKMPHLRGVELLQGDVRDFTFPEGRFAFVIHAATEASAKQEAERPGVMQTTILEGTARMLEFAKTAGTRRFLFTSSGAMYGPQPAGMAHIPEDYNGDPVGVYAQAKLAAEEMCAAAAGDGLEVAIARCFAFVGPHLPMDTHFAAGNFLADALAGRTIRIASDGASGRSYLYAGELTVWLWTMLFRAESLRVYNVGSEQAVTIRELAEAVARCVEPPIAIEVAGVADASKPAHRYVPSTARARAELGLRQEVSLDEALRRTLAWHRIESELVSTTPQIEPVEPNELADVPEANPHGPFAALRKRLPKGEVIRFLMVGACNTAFSIVLQALFGALFSWMYPHAIQSWIAIAAVLVATPFGVTFSFLGFKHFVFRTKGNYLKEWVRCFAVYGPTIPAAILIVGVATRLYEATSLPHQYAKDAAFVTNSAIIAVYSYLGHKKFSFKR